MNFIEVKKKNSLLTHKKTQPSSQPHAGFFESNDAIPAQFFAHTHTFDSGVVRGWPWDNKEELFICSGIRKLQSQKTDQHYSPTSFKLWIFPSRLHENFSLSLAKYWKTLSLCTRPRPTLRPQTRKTGNRKLKWCKRNLESEVIGFENETKKKSVH